jgi:hypothetical protein
MVELIGKTLGLIGLGRIGVAFAWIASAMGMHVVAHDLYWPDAEKLEGLAIEQMTMDEVFERADVISLHCPLTPEVQWSDFEDGVLESGHRGPDRRPPSKSCARFRPHRTTVCSVPDQASAYSVAP